jgi:tRNA pseudouridine38-40 synthase
MRAFRVAYDGAGYRGFQRQPHGETVEDTLFEAFEALDIPFEDGVPAGYSAAGRTDAGVSARAQTVVAEAPEWLTPRALNGELPAGIRAWAHADVHADFHATHDAVERTYRYFLYAPEIDDERAERAAGRLSGRQDFHNFTPDETGTERDLTVRLRRDGPFLLVDCIAGGFARQLVRRIVTAVAAVGSGECDPVFLDRALGDEPLDGPDGIAPAAPEPLVLLDVAYPGIEFEADDVGVESAREVFGERRRQRLATARVAGSLTPESADR